MNKRFEWSQSTLAKLALAIAFLLPATLWASAPTQPGAITASPLGSSTTLSWAASTDDEKVAGYNVYQDGFYLRTVPSNSTIIDTAISIGRVYYVVAFDRPSNGGPTSFSPRSAEFTLTASDAEEENPTVEPTPSNGPVPTAATNLKAVRDSATTAIITWTAASDDVSVKGYNVYRSQQYITTVIANTQYSDSQLSPNQAYQYYVVAFDDDNNFSPRSLLATLAIATPKDEPEIETEDTQAPAVVTTIGASSVSTNQVTLFWDAGTDNVGVVGYNVYRNGDYIDTVSSNGYVDNNAPSTRPVSYQIVAFDEARNFSPASAEFLVGNIVETEPEPETENPSGGGAPYVDLTAAPIAGPDANDPFGYSLELGANGGQPTAGGPPTTPVNLRVELVSNDWAEINWAPSDDDVQVAAYKIYRSDGTVYTVRNEFVSNGGTQAEIDKYWRTTSFIDCNYTRFYDTVHNCGTNSPKPGDTYSYTVTAVDNEGQESAASNEVTITYHLRKNAPVPLYRDFYLNGDDKFASITNLSNTDNFLDQFVMVFEDEFSGEDIDATKWNTALAWGDSTIINGEQQFFVDTQSADAVDYNPFNMTGTSLKIEAIPTPDNIVEQLPAACNGVDSAGKKRCALLSGALSSHDLLGLTYGYVEARIKAGSESGMLSSFYMYHRFPGGGIKRHAPEIDILEYLGENIYGAEDAFQTYHYNDVVEGSIRSAPTMSHQNPDGSSYSDDFHTYGVLWEPQLIIWYIDGVEVKRITGPQVARQQMNVILYLVTGSAWAPTPDLTADIYPMALEVDYVRAYQRPPYNTNGVYPK